MFLGEYQHGLTKGKRLALPKKIRAQITGTEVILSKGFEPCINGFDKPLWEETAKQPLAIPLYEERGRSLRRQMFAAAQVVEIDKQGRIILPDSLASWAGIKDEIIVVGVGDHFEIWESKKWDEYLKKEII